MPRTYDGEFNFAGREGVSPFLTIEQKANNWMHTPGGRKIMRDLYAKAANMVPRWKKTKIPISIALLFELQRQQIKEVKARCQRFGMILEKDYGYTLNNTYRAYVARHMMNRRPEWEGMFETRTTEGE